MQSCVIGGKLFYGTGCSLEGLSWEKQGFCREPSAPGAGDLTG